MKQIDSFIQHLPDRTDARQLLDALVEFLTEGNSGLNCRVFVRDPFSGSLILCRSVPDPTPSDVRSLAADFPLAAYFRRNPKAMLTVPGDAGAERSEFEESAREQLSALGARLCVPLFARDQLLGLVMTGWQDGGVGHSASAPDELAEVARHVGPFLDFLMAAGARDLIGRISNGVAHDAQGLLTPMSALIQLVEAGGESNLEKAARMLPVARESLKTLEELLQHARRAPGIQQPRTKAVRVDEIVGRVVQGMRSELDGKRISLVADLQPITVSADETLILRLIRNLLANSGNAVLPGGWIRVTLASSAGEPESKFVARISITDSGPGFEAEILEKIFSPVMAIVGAGSGQTGIGLTVCRWIVYLHHGELKIFSQPGRPTTVQIDLPGWG